jgi:DMSO/TMAO reductase YedYZ molybdopterin-dependent catalytic subunit
MTIKSPDRRRLLGGAVASAGALLLGGCDQIESAVSNSHALNLAEDLNLRIQRWLLSPTELAPEFTEAELSPVFKANGTENPPDKDYQSLARTGFANWQLLVDGLVERPARLSLNDLRAMPSRTQITRHDCVEGWSCIGKWRGVSLSNILQLVGLKPQARFVVFHCADSMGGSTLDETADEEGPSGTDVKRAEANKADVKNADVGGSDAGDGKQQSTADSEQSDDQAASGPKYYESLDLVDAVHPQTILAYDMNDAPLTIAHGAPVRLRVERQLGYKSAKYVMRIEVVESFAHIGEGRGGYWEDLGYDWYAGI